MELMNGREREESEETDDHELVPFPLAVLESHQLALDRAYPLAQLVFAICAQAYRKRHLETMEAYEDLLADAEQQFQRETLDKLEEGEDVFESIGCPARRSATHSAVFGHDGEDDGAAGVDDDGPAQLLGTSKEVEQYLRRKREESRVDAATLMKVMSVAEQQEPVSLSPSEFPVAEEVEDDYPSGLLPVQADRPLQGDGERSSPPWLQVTADSTQNVCHRTPSLPTTAAGNRTGYHHSTGGNIGTARDIDSRRSAPSALDRLFQPHPQDYAPLPRSPALSPGSLVASFDEGLGRRGAAIAGQETAGSSGALDSTKLLAPQAARRTSPRYFRDSPWLANREFLHAPLTSDLMTNSYTGGGPTPERGVREEDHDSSTLVAGTDALSKEDRMLLNRLETALAALGPTGTGTASPVVNSR